MHVRWWLGALCLAAVAGCAWLVGRDFRPPSAPGHSTPDALPDGFSAIPAPRGTPPEASRASSPALVAPVRLRLDLPVRRERVSPEAARVAGLHGHRDSLRARAEALASLDGPLSADDALALVDFLRAPPEDAPLLAWNALKNNVVNRMLDDVAIWPQLGMAMSEMLLDPNLDEGWRDYVAQFMPAVAGRFRRGDVHPVAGIDARAVHAELLSAWWAATDETRGSIAGAAILGLLRHASEAPDDVDAAAVADKAVELAESSAASMLTRIHALQAAADAGDLRALPVARRLAMCPPTALRRSAVAALGTLGGAEEAVLLRKLADDRETRAALAPAIDSALTRIAERERGRNGCGR